MRLNQRVGIPALVANELQGDVGPLSFLDGVTAACIDRVEATASLEASAVVLSHHLVVVVAPNLTALEPSVLAVSAEFNRLRFFGAVIVQGKFLRLDAYRSGAVVAGPASHLRVSVGLPKDGPASALVTVVESVGPLLAVAHIWGHALAKVVTLLRAHGDATVVALPSPLAGARVRQRAIAVVIARLRAYGDSAVASGPARGAPAGVGSHARSVVEAAPNDLVDALAVVLEPATHRVRLLVVIRDPGPESEVGVLHEEVVARDVQHVVQVDRRLSVRARPVELKDARSLLPLLPR
mmetsp:Transcript_8411/g.17447  ORF Transcript_8411/g.17447 Transcript_8411/m.17447 type:complete len:295 (-) Transcript_8411:148-1032(-)